MRPGITENEVFSQAYLNAAILLTWNSYHEDGQISDLLECDVASHEDRLATK
jgi:hypothetical protein